MDELQRAKEWRQRLHVDLQGVDEYIAWKEMQEKMEEFEHLLPPSVTEVDTVPAGDRRPSTVVEAIRQYGAAHRRLRAGPVADHLVQIGMYSDRRSAIGGVRSTLSNRRELFERIADGVYQLRQGEQRPMVQRRRRGVMAQRRQAFLEHARQHEGRLVITQARENLVAHGLFKDVEQYRNQSYKLVKRMPEFAMIVPGEFVLKSYQAKPSDVTPLRVLLDPDHLVRPKPTETNGIGLPAATQENRAVS